MIGCHYDGEADSTESAYDDGSGCAIELGVAEAMAAFWRAHHLYPARTLRFVLFDAEEQGLFGSYEYVNKIARNDLADMTMMINEEQNGIAYPLRYLGKSSNPLMPFFAFLSPLSGNNVYRNYSVTPRQLTGLQQLRTLDPPRGRRGVPELPRDGRSDADLSRPGRRGRLATCVHASAGRQRARGQRHARQQRSGAVHPSRGAQRDIRRQRHVLSAPAARRVVPVRPAAGHDRADERLRRRRFGSPVTHSSSRWACPVC